MELIPFTYEHFALLASWFDGQPAVTQWGGPLVHYPLDDEQLEAMVAEGRRKPPQRLCWMARQDELWVGHVQAALDWRARTARLGRVVVTPEARGRGMAAPMLRQALTRVFAIPEMDVAGLNVYTFNKTALKVYQRLGFMEQSVKVGAIVVEGQPWDSAYMVITREQFGMPSEPGE